jgi:L-fucose mutarotase/ribose pyranase (RbsD/FucU family)
MTDRAAFVPSDWERHLSSCIPLFGHRNWIVVADAAYPAQSKPGIETIVATADQSAVVRKVLDAIISSGHIRPIVYVDRELAFVQESDAPGVADYRKELEEELEDARVERLPHEQIIHKLDECAEVFRILIIKTDMTIPYTSVFFELDCSYWNATAEERLRQAMRVAEAE